MAAKRMNRIRRGAGSGRRPKGGGGAKSKTARQGKALAKWGAKNVGSKKWAPPHGSGRDFGRPDRVPRNTKRF